MKPDDLVCYCFRVSRRKLENFAKREKLRVASQMSACGGAGTGCGWCIPFLHQIFRQTSNELDAVAAADYSCSRAAYLRDSQRTPPAGAEPTPADSA